jgi:hypothetical protein
MALKPFQLPMANNTEEGLGWAFPPSLARTVSPNMLVHLGSPPLGERTTGPLRRSRLPSMLGRSPRLAPAEYTLPAEARVDLALAPDTTSKDPAVSVYTKTIPEGRIKFTINKAGLARIHFHF